jgi:hypothetical protein
MNKKLVNCFDYRYMLLIIHVESPTWHALLEEAVLGCDVPVESLPVGPEQAVLL